MRSFVARSKDFSSLQITLLIFLVCSQMLFPLPYFHSRFSFSFSFAFNGTRFKFQRSSNEV